VRAANIEANLVYLDREESELDGGRLEDRLPVAWQKRSGRVCWPDAPESPDEDQEADGLGIPSVFAWATYNPKESQIVVGLAPQGVLPIEWEIRLPQTGSAPLASHQQYPGAPPIGRLVIPITRELLALPLTTLRVHWVQDHESHDALLPVHVDDRGQLPPLEALGALTAEGILACLLSGCDPAEWVDRQLDWNSTGTSRGAIDPAIDPHRFHDPSGLALYKVRRLGRALAAMGQRLVGTVRTPEAIEYHIHRHPLGPVRLAEALGGEATQQLIDSAKTERARLAFSLIEVALMLAHAGKGIHRLRQPGEADHRESFRRGTLRIFQQADSILATTTPNPAADGHADHTVRAYRAACWHEAERLLASLQIQEVTPCL
jgi:hypothetical protein